MYLAIAYQTKSPPKIIVSLYNNQILYVIKKYCYQYVATGAGFLAEKIL